MNNKHMHEITGKWASRNSSKIFQQHRQSTSSNRPPPSLPHQKRQRDFQYRVTYHSSKKTLPSPHPQRKSYTRPTYLFTTIQIGAASLLLCVQPISLNVFFASSLPCVTFTLTANLKSAISTISVMPFSSPAGAPSPIIRSCTLIMLGTLCLVKSNRCG